MTTTIFNDGQPMTESEYLALGETSPRIELLDGSILVTPAPTPHHQLISRRLANALDPGATALGLHVHEAVNVRLGPDFIPIPDIVVTAQLDFKEPVVDATLVRLVGEITSPSNATMDKAIKPQFYAAAGIPWYLLIEHETCTLRLYQLVDTAYKELSVTRPGEILHLTEPVEISIDPADLQPPH